MHNKTMPRHATVISPLDPTYTLTDSTPRLTANQLPAYLRFHYLFFGSLIIPRTYLIHGRYNTFVELYRSGQEGQKEMQNLFTSGVAFITGHDDPSFQRLQDHLSLTAEEQHPLVFDFAARTPIVTDLNSLIPPEHVVTLPIKKVTTDFRERFKAEYLSFPGIKPIDWIKLDTFARERLKERNVVNFVKYPEGKWGRNEICDLIARSALSHDAHILADCAVVAYQRIFAESISGGTSVMVRSSATLDKSHEVHLPLNLAAEPSQAKTWELDYADFSLRPWNEIRELYSNIDWQRNLYNFQRALTGFNRAAAESSLTKLFEILQAAYPVRKNRASVVLNWIAGNTAIALLVDVIGTLDNLPHSWCIIGPHASVVLAAYLNNQAQRMKKRQNVRLHLNYLLKPIGNT